MPALRRRWRVYALVRQRETALRESGVVQLRGDLDRPDSLARLAGIADAVLYSAPPPETGSGDPRMKRFLAVIGQGKSLPRRLVYISTSGVYGDCMGARIAETRRRAPATARAGRRVDAEDRLRAFGRGRQCRVSILRAPGIYAADRLPLERIRRGTPAFLATEDSYTNHIHAEDLAGACVAALERGGANRAYNASDDSGLAMGEWFDLLADAFGLPRPPRIGRAEARERLSPLLLSFMNESRRLDNRRLKQELGLRLRYPTVEAGIAEAVPAVKGDPCSG
ncbi:MAG: NAD(P)H-binding protein [Rhodocyclaceae bacterium]|nr:NAD(P)H-binding protein [Rhodocyclaceae bacterium]